MGFFVSGYLIALQMQHTAVRIMVNMANLIYIGPCNRLLNLSLKSFIKA